MMEHNRQRKVTTVFPKIPQTNFSKNYASLYSALLQYYDGLHNGHKINTSQSKFQEKLGNQTQSYTAKYLRIGSKDLFQMLQDEGTQQVGKSDVSFPKKNPLGKIGNFEPHWSRFLHSLMICILMTFFRCVVWDKWGTIGR